MYEASKRERRLEEQKKTEAMGMFVEEQGQQEVPEAQEFELEVEEVDEDE